jgi:hypothetical protein
MMEWWIAGLVMSVAYLALALWRIEQRGAALEGLTGNALQRAIGQWVQTLSPRGQVLVADVVRFGAFPRYGCCLRFGVGHNAVASLRL